jgi:hypothetical protein
LRLEQELLTPTRLYGSLLRDEAGVPRVAFVINPSDEDLEARWAFERDLGARDALTGAAIDRENRALTLVVRKRSAAMLELDWLS